MLLYENLIPKNASSFVDKLKSISSSLGINPNWLMLLMKHESGLDSSITNNIGATGLIQFLPSTAKSLGTSSGELASMTNVQQLDYVKKFYQPYAGKIKSYGDLHLVAFFPAALGKPDNYVFETANLAASKVAQQNKAFDLNGDGKITAGEARKYFNDFANRTVPTEFKEQFQKYSNTMEKVGNWLLVAGIVLILAYASIKAINS